MITSFFVKKNIGWLVCIITIMGVKGIFAQPKINISQLKKSYPNDEMVFLNRTEKVNISIVKDSLQIDVLHDESRAFLDERASFFADASVYYSQSFQEISNLKATSHVPDKASFKSIPVSDIKTERPSPGGGIFFDDMQVKRFTFPSAKMGGIGTVSYHERIKNPYMLSGFIFGNYVPVINSEFSVTFPATVKVSYKTYGDMKAINFKKTVENGNITYTWKAQNLAAYTLSTNSPSLRYYAPQVFLLIENYTINNKTTEVLGNVDKLFNFYKSLVKDLNQKPSTQLQMLTDSLTKGKTELEKIRAIYYWVQDHIKYIAFEEGLGGFIPRQAADVCQKRYGDCKDMASLTSTMLRLANIDAKLVWIGTRELPYKYTENPSMSVDNHMIAAIKYNGKWEFLDATDDRIDFGLPTSHIQGKEALIMTTDDNYEIVDVPIVTAKKNYKNDSVSVTLEGRTLKGKGELSFGGLWKTSLKSSVQYMSESKRDSYYKDLLSRGSNKSALDYYKVNGIDQRDMPISIEYSVRVPDYVQEAAGEVFLNLHLLRPWTEYKQESTRKTDWKHDFRHLEENVVVLNIPQGYEVTNTPANTYFTNPKFGFKITYQQKDNQLILRSQLLLDTLIVKNEDFVEWNKMIDTLTDAYSEVVSLKKK